MWRKNGGGVIVEEGNGASIKTILQAIEGNMVSGRTVAGKTPDREDASSRPSKRGLPMNGLDGWHDTRHVPPASHEDNDDEQEGQSRDPRKWMRTISALEQPRLMYNASKKHFEALQSNPSLFPDPSHQFAMWRDRYNLVYQRLLRNESFQTPSIGTSSSLSSNTTQSYKLTPIANLLGRSGSSHLLLGLLSVSPAGELSLTDLTGSIVLDLSHARSVPENGAWFTPGMIVLVDGIYEEEDMIRGSTLGGNSGIGGAIGGKFVGISIAGPPCERREVTLGMSSHHSNGDIGTSGGFGWIDFLGVGSERAQGPRMRKLEAKYLRQEQDKNSGRRNIIIMGEVNLDNMRSSEALKNVFKSYSASPLDRLPLAFILIGNFVEHAGMGQGSRGNSIEYKEYFDTLASVLSDFPILLQHSTFVFVPGDNDPWASTFSAGAATVVPRESIPELFTSRVKRAFSTANNESERSDTKSLPGEAIWTSNPSRLSLFGPVHEIVVLRDNISGRLRRCAVNLNDGTGDDEVAMSVGNGESLRHTSLKASSMTDNIPEDNAVAAEENQGEEDPSFRTIASARKLVKTILDQGNLSPFPLTSRPVLWDYASALHLHPLPTALILADAETSPFTTTYEGCHVMNPGKFLPDGKRGTSRWIEYDVLRNRARVREQRH
jgi:DNA polymerase epsilon subunit 2